MKLLTDYLRELVRGTARGWNRFWFTPADPATLGLVRILAGAMLFYTHLVWTRGLFDFFTEEGWLNTAAVTAFQGGGFAWSYHWYLTTPTALLTAHVAALVVFALLTVGLFTRVASVLACLAAISYVNRVPGALFGLDQINTLLAMYVMVGPAGACYSLDAWRARRRGASAARVAGPSIGANVAIRLIQVHMCVIYLFAGLSKLGGPNWWAGTALWGAIANLEYQSLDVVWLVQYPLIINVLTLSTLMWEISYCTLVWPRLTRPLVILMAIPLHLGIAVCMGMITFGLAMLIGNLAFVEPWVTRRVIDPLAARLRGLGRDQTQPTAAPPRTATPGSKTNRPARLSA